MTRTGVGSHFSATHRGPNGTLHGHTWTVKAWFPAGPDALMLRDELQFALDQLDHRELPEELSQGEAMAEAIGRSLIGCVGVDIAREADGIYASWALGETFAPAD